MSSLTWLQLPKKWHRHLCPKLINQDHHEGLPHCRFCRLLDGRQGNCLAEKLWLPDAANKILVTDSILFQIVSPSKLFVTTAILQLWEDGLFTLDNDINDYLPEKLKFRNPFRPNDKITFQMLLTHSSSIKDDWDNVISKLYSVGDSPIAIDSFLVDYLTPAGKWYSKYNNFWNWKPGSKSYYSNVGFTLLAYLVESISGLAFNAYSNEYLFKPMKMEESAYRLSELDTSKLSLRHSWNCSCYTTYEHDGTPLYPTGWLKTTWRHLANFMINYFHRRYVLSMASVDTIFQHYYYDGDYNEYQGFGWYQKKISGKWFWGHSGGWVGVVTDLYFDRQSNRGFISLVNTGWYDSSWDGADIIVSFPKLPASRG